MIGPTDLLHPSPAPHFKTFEVLLITVFIGNKMSEAHEAANQCAAVKGKGSQE
jgi:hypothetical protein